MRMIITTPDNNGKRNGVNVFNSVQANDNNWYCAENSRNDFPELFTGDETVVELNIDDFPKPQLLIFNPQ